MKTVARPPQEPPSGTPSRPRTLLSDLFLEGFLALRAAIAGPAVWERITSTKGLKPDSSLADLGAEFSDATLELVMLLFQLAAACILTVAVQGVVAVGAVHLLDPGISWMEALQPFLLAGGAALGFGAVVACALGLRAGAAVSVLTPALILPILVLADVKPGLNIAGVRVFSATGGIRDLGYWMGGFSVGAALALAGQYLQDRGETAGSQTAPRGHAVLTNILLSLALLIGYALISYRILQGINGQENAKWPAVLFLLLPWTGILYRQYQRNPASTWKAYALSIAPMSFLVGGGVAIAATVYETWSLRPGFFLVDRLGVGLMTGALLSGTMVFLSALVSPLFPGTDQRGWSSTVATALTAIALFTAIAVGAFDDLNRNNRTYMIPGGIAGLLSAWILTAVRRPGRHLLLRASVCLVLLFPAALHAQTTPREPANPVPTVADYVGRFALTGTSHVHAVADFVVFTYEYNRDFTPDIEAAISATPAPGELLLTVTHKEQTQRIVGRIQLDGTVAFAAGQKSPQKFDGEGFVADLTGTLRDGSATLSQGTLRVQISWAAEGMVSVAGVPKDVSGTIVSDLHGPRRW